MENGEVVVSMTPPSSPPTASVRNSHSSTSVMASTSTLRNKKSSISGSQDSPMDLSLRSFPKMPKSLSKDSHSSDHSQSKYFVAIFHQIALNLVKFNFTDGIVIISIRQ